MPKQVANCTDERQEVGKSAFITKKGENEPLDELDLLSDIDDEAFEAELDLSLEARAKIMKEENDKKVAKQDLDKQQRHQLKEIVTKKRVPSAVRREPAI